jgi:hypothetical protein
LEEKNYIYKWVEENQKINNNNDFISWKLLQPEMETKFGKFRSRNSLKNTWNARKRFEARHEARNRVKIELPILEHRCKFDKREKNINRIHKTIDEDVC